MNSRRYLALVAMTVILCPWATSAEAQSYPSSKKAGKIAKKNGLVCKFYFVELELGGGGEIEELSRDETFVKWLVEKIPQAANPGTWQHNPGFIELAPFGRSGILFVCQTPEAHVEVDAFFKSLRTSLQEAINAKKIRRTRDGVDSK